MTAMSAASTLGHSWNRLPGHNERKTHDLQPLPRGERFAPPRLATLDLPRGKVLMVVDDAALVLDLQRMLHRGGYRAIGPTTTVPEIQRMIQRCDIDCAILDLDIDRRTPLPVADLLAFADLPFVYLATGGLGSVPPRHRHRPVVDRPLTREKLMAAVEKAIAGRRHVAHADRWDGAAVVPGTRVYPPL